MPRVTRIVSLDLLGTARVPLTSVKVGIGSEAAQQQSVDAVVRHNADTRRHGRMSRVDV